MADSDALGQDEGPVPVLPIVSRPDPHSHSPSSYGFPQGKAQDFFFPRRAQSCRTLHQQKKTRKMPKPSISIPTLNINDPKPRLEPHSPLSPSLSPPASNSPMSGPPSPYSKNSTIRPVTGHKKSATDILPLRNANNNTPPAEKPDDLVQHSVTAIPQLPPSPRDSPKNSRDPQKSFFSNLKASKSSHRIHTAEATAGDHNKPKSRGNSTERTVYPVSRANQSTPDLPGAVEKREETGENTRNRSESVNHVEPDQVQPLSKQQRNKPRFGNLLTRSRSIRHDDHNAQSLKLNTSSYRPTTSNGLKSPLEEPLKTAPLDRESGFKDMAASTRRNRSADRPPLPSHEDFEKAMKRDESPAGSKGAESIGVPKKDKQRHAQPTSLSNSFNSTSGSSLLSNIKQSSSGAADRLGKAGKGFFGKLARSGSHNEREQAANLDENYVCSVINLPLVEQTRKTRISKRLEDSKDKTEFWMPALPWRCIDYLNYKGCEEEGLYRVPGSGKEVRHWQRRFDTG